MKNRHELLPKMYIIFVIFAAFSLSGCGDRTQIEDRDFVLAAGVSYDSDMYKMSFARPNLSVLTGQPVGEDEKFVVTYQGYHFYDIEKEYSRNSDKMLDFSHLKTIILDYKIISNQDKMKEFLQYVENNYKISRNTLVFYTDLEEEEILNLNDSVSGNIGEYLEEIYENNVKKIYEEKTTIGDLIHSLYETDKVSLIPKVIMEDKKAAISGAGLFQEGVLLKKLTVSELESVCLSMGKGKNYDLALDKDAIVRIRNIKKICHYTINEGLPYILIEIKGETEIMQNPGGESSEKLKYEVDAVIKNVAAENLNYIMKKEKIDFLNLYRTSAYKNKNIWLHYKNRQERFIDDLKLDRKSVV